MSIRSIHPTPSASLPPLGSPTSRRSIAASPISTTPTSSPPQLRLQLSQTDRSGNRILRGIVNGWRTSGLIQHRSGDALTAYMGTDNSLTGLTQDRAQRDFTKAAYSSQNGGAGSCLLSVSPARQLAQQRSLLRPHPERPRHRLRQRSQRLTPRPWLHQLGRSRHPLLPHLPRSQPPVPSRVLRPPQPHRTRQPQHHQPHRQQHLLRNHHRNPGRPTHSPVLPQIRLLTHGDNPKNHLNAPSVTAPSSIDWESRGHR